MSTSGINYYQLTRNDLINAVMRKLGVLAKGQTPDTEDITNAAQAINLQIAGLRAIGMPLWARKTFTFNPVLNTQSYTIGTGSTLNTPYPVKMLEAYRIDATNTSIIPIDIKASVDFNQLPLTPGGPPLVLNYTPGINIGTLKLWPVPDSSSVTSTVQIVYQRPFEYFINATDTMDLPEEWYLPLVYGTAVSVAPEWGIPLADRNMLKQEYSMYLEMAQENAQEDGSFFISPRRAR